MKIYRAFTRTWWRNNPSWPNGLEPCPGRRHVIARNLSWEEAREVCQRYNSTHKPGRLSRKAEFEEQP